MAKRPRHSVMVDISMRLTLPARRPGQRKLLARLVNVKKRLLRNAKVTGDISNSRDFVDALELLASSMERARASAHNRTDNGE